LIKLGVAEKHHAVIQQLKGYVTPILSFIPREMPDYTDHGLRHSNNILAHLSRFRTNLGVLFPTFSFTEEELFLLCLATYLHDIGCIVDRKGHNNESGKLLTDHPTFCFLSDWIGADLLPCLNLIVRAHSSSFDLSKISREPLHEKVRLRLMCAIFRLLDGCEISAARVSKTLYEILTSKKKIKKKGRKFWDAHLSIYDLYFKGNDIIVECQDLAKAKFLTDHLVEDLVQINKVFSEENFPSFSVKIVTLNFEQFAEAQNEA
jgi:hypothetical protein